MRKGWISYADFLVWNDPWLFSRPRPGPIPRPEPLARRRIRLRHFDFCILTQTAELPLQLKLQNTKAISDNPASRFLNPEP